MLTRTPVVTCDHNQSPHPLDQFCRNPTGQLPQPTQPAPKTGEWRLFEHYRNATGERTRVLDASGIVIAETQTEAQALEIVRDHNALPQLVAALDAAMKVVADRAAGGRMLTTTKEANQIWRQCDEAIRAAQGGSR